MNKFQWAAAGLAFAMTPLTLSPAQAQEEIVIPSIAAMSGSVAVTGQDAQKGVEIALEHINADGDATCETVQLPPVATQRDDHGSAPLDRHAMPRPPIGGHLAQPHDRLLCHRALADRGKHPAGPPRTAMRSGPGRRISNRHLAASGDKFRRNAEPGNAGPKNDCPCHLQTS